MEQSGGQTAAKLAKPADGGEDRLSALPDEALVLILECLDTTAEAARTSVLARRWRGLCRFLSKLYFQLRPDGDRIRELLDVTDAPQLRHISVSTKGATADSVTAWLPAAARRLTGGLSYHDIPDLDNYDEEVEMARRGGTVQLPCFENATRIHLRLRLLGLALPSLGVFTRLTDLDVRFVEFRGPCELGDLVSSPRCPCLQKLSFGYSCGSGFRNLIVCRLKKACAKFLSRLWLESEMIAGSSSNIVSSSEASSSSSSSGPTCSKKGAKTEFEKKLGAFIKHQIETNSSEAMESVFPILS